MALAAFALPVQGQPRPAETIIILDGSGSMWGQVDGRSKILSARQAIGSILTQFQPSDRLGLMVYGHRSKTDCQDIETVVPVGPFEPERIRAAVDAVVPKGKTPLSNALRAAAGQVKSADGRGNVVLVSDGIETCGADPCAVAAELKKARVGLVAHVIGFDVADPVAKAQLQCIARATGGVYLDARNAGGLTTALTRVVEATKGRTIVSEAPPKPPADPYVGKTLRATVRLAEGSDPITDPSLAWHLHRPGPSADEPGEWIRTEYGPRLAIAERPGDYVLKVELGQTTRLYPASIQPGKVATYDLVLDAGFVTSEGTVAGSGAKAEPNEWQILTDGGTWVATAYDPVPKFVLPAGNYVLKLVKGSATAERPFALAPGDSINVPVSLDVGRLIVDAVFAGQEKVTDGVAFEVRKPARDPVTPGDSLETRYDAISAFDLPTGRYDLIVTVGLAKKIAPLEIRSGEQVRLTVDLGAGFVAISAPEAETIEILAARKSITGQRAALDTAYGDTFEKAMAAGDYVAVVTRGGRKVETRFSVTPGERTELDLK